MIVRREYGHGPGKSEGLTDAIGNDEREDDARRADNKRGAWLQNFMDFARDVEPPDDSPHRERAATDHGIAR